MQSVTLYTPVHSPEEAEQAVRDAWKQLFFEELNYPQIHVFEREPSKGRKISLFAKIPEPDRKYVDPDKPFLVACYQCSHMPHQLTILGFAPKYAPTLLVGNLSPDRLIDDEGEDTKTEEKQEIAPQTPLSPSPVKFYFFQGMPSKFPEHVSVKIVWRDIFCFYNWLRTPQMEVLPPIRADGITHDMLFFLLLVASLDSPTSLLRDYRNYIKRHCQTNTDVERFYVNTRITGANDLEETLMAIVTITIAKLKDTRQIWGKRLTIAMSKFIMMLQTWFES